MNKQLNNKFKKIIHDKISGSSELLLQLHNHLKKEKRIIQLFPELLNELQDKFKSFRNIQRYFEDLKKELKKNKNLDYFFNKYDAILLNVYDKIFLHCRSTLIKYSKFITISNSNTLFEILKRLKKERNKLSVTVLESRPKFEGRIMAKKLSLENIDVKLITEAMISEYVKKSDAALIGADEILKNGNIINKVGSASLAIVCKYHHVPFYVLADKNKISSKNHFDKKEMPPSEIWRHSSQIKIVNYYFEEVDKSLITKLFTS